MTAAQALETAPTVADAIVQRLAARGVRRMFGVPGGDCNLDIIEAAERHGIRFILTRTETSAAIMAAVTAELTGTIGVVMTTRGPGVTNAVNGVAYAALDRAPLLLIADAYEADMAAISHQRLDQEGVLHPLLRGAASLEEADPIGALDRILDAAMVPPLGPVYLEIVGPAVRRPAVLPAVQASAAPPAAPELAGLEAARALLGRARRPLVIAGLQAAAPEAAAALRRLVQAWDCPVLTTYKAKGAMPDDDPRALGHYIGGASEEAAIKAADLLLLYGFDPIEHPPGRWRYDAPTIELTRHRFVPHVLTPSVSLVGALAPAADALAGAVTATGWDKADLAERRAALRRRAAALDGGPIAPQQIVDAAMAVAPPGTRVAVDAGAHMLSVLHLWPAREPYGLMLSRGLATMGFSLPAGIASALAEPDRPMIAFTGDGGLMMCAAELGTAVQNKCRLVVVVFNDSSLTLIGAKQRRRQFANAGVDFSPADFAQVARGFGCAAWRVEAPDQLAPALREALAQPGPALLDVVVDPSAYHAQIVSLRG